MFSRTVTVLALLSFVLVGCSTSSKAQKTDSSKSEKVEKAQAGGEKMKKTKKKMAGKKKDKSDCKKKDCDCKKKNKKAHKKFMASFKKLDGFDATSETIDGKVELVMTADKKSVEDLQMKAKKFAAKMKKHHKNKKHHGKKSAKSKAKKHKKMKKKMKKKHHAKMMAVHQATIDVENTDSGAKLIFTPKSKDDLEHVSKYAGWKAALLKTGGCKPCAKKKYKTDKSDKMKGKDKAESTS